MTGLERPDRGSSPEQLGYAEILDRVAELTGSLFDDDGIHLEVRDRVEELVDWLDVFHREGLGRLVEMVRQWRGELFLEQAALDPVVGELLSTYGLGVDVDTSTAERVVQLALDEVRPYVHSHGGEIEVTSIVDGVVHLELHGSCNGCTAADDTIAQQVEVALREHWIDFRRVEVSEPTVAPHPPPVPGQVVTGLGIGRRPE